MMFGASTLLGTKVLPASLCSKKTYSACPLDLEVKVYAKDKIFRLATAE